MNWHKDLREAPYNVWIELNGQEGLCTGARLDARFKLQDQHGEFYTPDANIGAITAWRAFVVTAPVQVPSWQ